MRINQALLLISLCFTSGCYLSPQSKSTSATGTYTLATGKEEAGTRVQYDVASSRDGAPAIHRVSTRTLEVAQLGMTVMSIEKKLAEKHSIEPWRGVYISKVSDKSSSHAAGVAANDVLLSINGIELTSSEQFKGVVETVLPPEKPATMRLLRHETGRERQELTLEVTPKSKRIDETTTDRIALEAPSTLTRRTGLQIATVPANLSREIWASDGTRALVTSVVSGSPGYEGGIRCGDFVTSCNGQAVSDAQAIDAALKAGAKELQLDVDGPLGAHRGTIYPIADVEKRGRIHIPILINHSSRVDRTSTSFVHFIFQFGFSYSRESAPSTTRETNESTELSILPLGMFVFERSPTERRTTIFWFITWTSKT